MKKEIVFKNKNIIIPFSINEITSISKTKDNLLYYAGCSFLRCFEQEKLYERRNIVFLDKVKELKKIDLYRDKIEIGSMVTLNEVAENRKTPLILKQAISELFLPWIKNIATIGGNLFVNDEFISLLPLLRDLDCKIAFKVKNKIKTKKIKDLEDSDNFLSFLDKDAIVIKIIIPINISNIQMFKTLGNSDSKINIALLFMGFVNDDKIIEDFDIKFYFSNKSNFSIKIKEFISRSLPLKNNDIEAFFKSFIIKRDLKFWIKNEVYLEILENKIKKELLSLRKISEFGF